MVATNLGVIATVRGDHGRALDCHERALAHARVAGAAEEAMNALNNLGMLHTQMCRFDDAGRCYQEALEIGHVIGNLSICILAQLNVARLRVAEGDYPGARAACDEGMALAARIGTAQADGEAAHIYGVIARAAGDVAGAEAHFLRAENDAARRRDLILEAETSRELADLYRAQGRNRETLQRLNQSHRLFAQLQARRELADVDRRVADLEADFLEVVRKWGDSIESKDRYTQGHCVRVADLACALWSNVNGPDATSLFWFRIGALLHDVGKLMVPAEVLNKAGKLTAAEWAQVQRHPSAGVELLADIDFPWDVRPIVQSHHERWDGAGYPHGLAGEAIPLTARVLCIADVYDALTSERSYKQALTHDEAIDIMRRDIGKQFDPALFERFEAIAAR
jgi:putative nucleotidyltransferase with HDIG domain